MESNNLTPYFADLENPSTIIDEIEKVKEEVITGNAKNELIKATLEALEIKATDEIEPPKIAWEQINGTNSATLGTLGNFSLIIGKAKSKKTFAIGIAISTVLKDGLILDQFRGCLSEDKRTVLYFDTEQGKYHVSLAVKRICRQTNEAEPENLKTYGLRSKSPAERLQLIEYAIHNTPNLGLVVIDGIKDLVTSINDEEQASMIATNLLKWSEEKEIHIITVLHQNKNDKNARGHLGTELVNKAETVLSITKDENEKDISIVEAEYCRDKEPETFAFEIVDGLPVLAKDFQIRTESKKNKFDVLDLEDETVYKIVTNVFKNGTQFTYGEIIIQIKIAYKEMYQKAIGDNRAKELITHCKNNDWLIQEKPKAPYFLGKFQDED